MKIIKIFFLGLWEFIIYHIEEYAFSAFVVGFTIGMIYIGWRCFYAEGVFGNYAVDMRLDNQVMITTITHSTHCYKQWVDSIDKVTPELKQLRLHQADSLIAFWKKGKI